MSNQNYITLNNEKFYKKPTNFYDSINNGLAKLNAIELKYNAKYMRDPEHWKPITCGKLHDNYEISNYGMLRNKATKNILSQRIKNGYYYTTLKDNGAIKDYRVHRLVAKTFLSSTNLNVVNHIDGNPLNNYYKNLEWTTVAGNNQHAADNDLVSKTCRRVARYENGELIKTYDTIVQASKDTGCSIGSIVGVCKGVCTHSHGIVWRYVDANPNDVDIDPEKLGFRQIRTFPNYWVNVQGQVYSKPFKRFLKLGKHKNGALQIQLTRRHESGIGQTKKTALVHNLVALYFIKCPNKKEFNCIHHKNGNKENNNVNNLEWSFQAGISFNFDI